MEARDERRLIRLQRELQAYKLLIIDELGYVPLSTTGAELLFETISNRYERGSTIITSNLPFDEWTSVFGNERLTGALLDGTTFAASDCIHVVGHAAKPTGQSVIDSPSAIGAAPVSPTRGP